jgi:cysteine desulfurase/selenocysteine lyase
MIYADAAASALKPRAVIRTQADFLKNRYANAGRGICARAAAVDAMVEDTRRIVAKFIGAKDEKGIVFTSGATDGMNRMARMLEISVLTRDSVVIVSDLDHHSARLPFEELARRGKCKIWVCPLTDTFEMDADALHARCAVGDVAAVVLSAMSNVFGNPVNVKKLVQATKSRGSKSITIVDAAQCVAHEKTDVTDWDADALVFSGHKIGADTGIGVLYLKKPDKWSPSGFGGGMVARVMEKGWILADGPSRFEAGTLPLTQIAGLGPAIASRQKKTSQKKLLNFLYDELSSNPRIHPVTNRNSCMMTFTVDGMRPIDFGAYAGAYGVCLRAGNMCASWLHRALGVDGTVRISVGPWNTRTEMQELVRIINKIVK